MYKFIRKLRIGIYSCTYCKKRYFSFRLRYPCNKCAKALHASLKKLIVDSKVIVNEKTGYPESDEIHSLTEEDKDIAVRSNMLNAVKCWIIPSHKLRKRKNAKR